LVSYEFDSHRDPVLRQSLAVAVYGFSISNKAEGRRLSLDHMEDTSMKTSIIWRTGTLAVAIIAGGFASLPRTFAGDSQIESPTHMPRVTTLFAASEMPHTERTAAVGHRLFVTSDANLFEVVRDPHGKLRKVSVASASVTLSDGQSAPAVFLALATHGHVLYATATAFTEATVPYASALYRIDLGARAGEIATIASAPFVGHATPFLPNGMATDQIGDLFVSNSFSATTGEAAILKLRIHSHPFSFQEKDWLPANQGGAFPNGVQLDGNTLYLASQSVVLRVTVDREGEAGLIATLYTANPDDFLDDFTLVGNDLIVCEIDNPFATPVTSTSQLTVVARTGHNSGTVTRVIPLAATGIHPSSVAQFGEHAARGELVVTDYASGGLFTVPY
jgi:hypothetical protein